MKRWILGLLALLTPAMTLAQAQDSAVVTGGFGKWLIDSLFESGSVSDMAQQPGLIGTIIMPLSLMCMVVVVFIITMKSIQHLLVVAQAKDPDASPVSMTWAPLHMVIAVALVMPLPSGYSLGQYGGIWLAEQSNALGNIVTQRSTDFIKRRGAITPPPMPSMQAFVNGLAMSSVCKTMFNKYGDHMQALGNQRTYIQQVLYSGDSAKFVPSMSNSDDYESLFLSYSRRNDSGFLTDGGDLNDFCGSMWVKFKKAPDGNALQNTIPSFVVDPADCQDGQSNFCTPSGKKPQTQLQASLSQVDNQLSQLMLGQSGVAMGNSGAGDAIASNLLYDLDTRLEGMTDKDRMQDAINMLSDENQRIDKAVEAAEDLYEELRDRMYSAYAQAINRNNPEGGSGDWIDSLDRAGWPMLGLYWFQYTNTSDAVLKASKMTFQYNGSIDQFINRFEAQTQDKELALLLRTRIKKFKKRLSHDIQNTRFDSQPLVDENRPDAAAINSVSEEDLKNMNAADLRESLPGILTTFTEQAGDGNYNTAGDPVGLDIMNQWARSTVFPWLINTLRDGDIVSSMVNTGHNIIAVSEGIYAVNVFLRGMERANAREAEEKEDESWIASAANWIANPIDSAASSFTSAIMGTTIVQMFLVVLNDFAEYWKYVFFIGLFLAFYLPAMIMIQWLIGFVTWVLYIVEADVIIPIWGLLFVGEMGEKSFSPQTARQGFVHLLSILLYPSLMVIGFNIGLKVINLISPFLVDFLVIGFLNATDGYAFGIVSFVMGLFIIAIAAYQIIIRIFSIVLEFNDRAMSWIGQRMGYGEANLEQSARGGFMAVINEGKMHSRGNGSPSPTGGGGGASSKIRRATTRK